MDDYERDLETCRLHGWTIDELEEARAVHDAWWATRNDPENWQKMWPDRPMPYVICGAELVFPYPPGPAEATLPLIEQMCETFDMPSTERSPQRCPNGHPLAANTCLVGWEVCGCPSAHNGGHRTHYCRRCGETIRTPECVGAEPQKSRWN